MWFKQFETSALSFHMQINQSRCHDQSREVSRQESTQEKKDFAQSQFWQLHTELTWLV